MKRYLVMTVAGLALSGITKLNAQGLNQPVCQATGSTIEAQMAQDACQQAYDVFQFMAPQLGLALAGGNATAGQGSVLGGLGHFSVGVRGNVFDGQLPQVSQFSPRASGATPAQVLPSKSQIVGLPTADGAIGLYKGFPLAIANILGLDALVSATYVPSISSNNVSITPQNNWQFGYGARLGLISESIVTPGVSVTWIERDLPTTTIVGTTASGGFSDSLSVNNAAVKTSAWRVVASKSFIVFGVTLGAGQDTYKESAGILGSVTSNSPLLPGSVQASESLSQNLTRNNIFADLSLNLPLFKLVGEVGDVSGGSVNTYNSFSGGRADRSIVYGSAGLRLSW